MKIIKKFKKIMAKQTIDAEIEVYFPADAIVYCAKPGAKAGNDVLDDLIDEIRHDSLYRIELAKYLETVFGLTRKYYLGEHDENPEKDMAAGFRNN